MTVTYTAEVATCRGLGCFIKLLARWRGSIYKLVWLDLFIFLSLYYGLNLMYRFALNDDQKRVFENIVDYCNTYSSLIPLSFVLGFYVSIVMTRWWNQYTTIPWPDSIAVFVSATIQGQDERGRVMRRTVMRYVCLCVTMMFTMISPRVKKRFPTSAHLVEAGFLQPSEKEIIDDLDCKFPKYSKHWMPIVWAAGIISRARKEGRVRDDFAVKTMIDELNKLRGQCGLLLSYDTISVPLVYTQVVTVAVYSYFVITAMGQQWVNTNKFNIDLYFPVFSTLQLFFYVGWLKVAESLINPFGDDDDDFEINWMIDRNLQVSYLIVDEMHHVHPELVKDQYWDEVFPQELPYTLASEPFRDQHPLPSTANISVKNNESELFIPSSAKADEIPYDDLQSAINFTAKPGSFKRSGSRASNLGSSVPDSMQRVSSVASKLKRLFSKEDKPSESRPSTGSSIELAEGAGSTLNVKPQQLGSMRITDQVIEEVDEQTTITSQKSMHEKRPTVMSLFGPPTPSAPVPVPMARSAPFEYSMNTSRPAHPHSAPTKGATTPKDIDFIDAISIGSADDDCYDDEFKRLRDTREQERRSRLALNLARSLSRSDPLETEMLLLDMMQSGSQSTQISSMNV